MKKSVYVVLLIASLCATGCSDNFFDKAPEGALDKSKIDDRLLQSYRNSIYQYVGTSMPGYSAIFLDGYADNGYSRNSWDSNGSAVQSNTLDANLDFGYDYDYNGIRTCNRLIKEVDNFEGTDATLRAKYKNEARVMRAWLYMDLTLMYGDVPIVTTPENDFPGGLARTSAKEVRQWILKELDEAINELPAANDKGYFNKITASAIKARASYYFGDYAAAEKAARYVIDNGGYQLHKVSALTDDMKKDADYFRKLVDFSAKGIDETAFINGIFNYQDIWKADNSPETIIAREYDASEDYGAFERVTSLMSPNMVKKQAWATIVPIQELVDAYWTVDGKTRPVLASMDQRVSEYKKLTGSIPQESFDEIVPRKIDDIVKDPYMAQYRNRDSRLYASVTFPFSSISRFLDGEYQKYIPDIVNYGRSGFVFRKMAGADDVISAWGDAYFLSGVDFPIIRLAEMLLIYAEAHTQTTGYDASVTAELNKLRERAGMPSVPSGLNKNEALDFIRCERRIELAGEGLRFFDIRLYEDDSRNGGYKGTQAASVVMKGRIMDVVGNPGAELKWTKRLEYMPIPTTAIDKNKALKQNEGY